MKYVAIYHANLNYAFLIPENYERVIRASYEVIIDGYAKYPEAKYVFEASGYTIEQMAKLTPDVLEKLKAAIDRGQCEFMGAPYSHPIMANVPREDGTWSCEFAQRVFEKHLGFRPESFWNPECTWMQYVPYAFRDAGVKYLTLDFESYMVCNDKEYGWVERNRAHDMNWGGHIPWYDLDPDCPYLHRPFRNVVPGLHGMCRSDRLVGKYLSYFRGSTTIEEYLDNVKYWTGQKSDDGALIIVADDAEYCGTTGYYYVKYHGDYSRSFDIDPSAPELLDKMIQGILELGDTATFKEACEKVEPVDDPFFVEDNFAWHRTYAKAWGNTPEARAWDPILAEMRREYKAKYQPIVEAEDAKPEFKQLAEEFWFNVTNSANSDGRWPPPPQVTCKFNRDWVLEQMQKTRETIAKLAKATEGVDVPPAPEAQDISEDDWRYGFEFTEKDPEDVRHLNNYELQHCIYYANKMIDSNNEEKNKEGLALMRKIFDELDRRGMKGIRHQAIRDE